MKIVLVGASGFVGTRLIKLLNKSDFLYKTLINNKVIFFQR